MYKNITQSHKLHRKTMKTWRVELTEGGKRLAEKKIQRGIFQGDALSTLLFIISMMPHNHIENAQLDTNFVDRKKRSIT